MKSSEYIKHLDMTPHPEGGYYAASYHSQENITDGRIRERFSDDRKLWTSIYFLLEENQVSNFHKLKSDELWYFHDGSPLTIYMILEDGTLQRESLGLDIVNGQRPQVLVPKGAIFGSVKEEEGFSLVGCMVSPGFEFEDFYLFEREELVNRFPEHSDIIMRLTKESQI
ncbi:MAG: cupin domain-containing protein [Bacillota bacterium]